MREYRATHSRIREKFVDGGLHPKLSASPSVKLRASRLWNNPSACLPASAMRARREAPLERSVRGSDSTRAKETIHE
jgi:hypothetical protein